MSYVGNFNLIVAFIVALTFIVISIVGYANTFLPFCGDVYVVADEFTRGGGHQILWICRDFF